MIDIEMSRIADPAQRLGILTDLIRDNMKRIIKCTDKLKSIIPNKEDE